MAINIRHRGAPEVIPEHVANGGEGEYVLVEGNGRYVVVHKVSSESVHVAGDGDRRHEAVRVPATIAVFDRVGHHARPADVRSLLHPFTGLSFHGQVSRSFFSRVFSLPDSDGRRCFSTLNASTEELEQMRNVIWRGK